MDRIHTAEAEGSNPFTSTGVISREIGNFRTLADHDFLGRVGPLGAPVA
jgi:hypothetical protein